MIGRLIYYKAVMFGVAKGVKLAVLVAGIGMLFCQVAAAYRFSSTSYVIDASVANNFGGQNSSASYSLTTSGGETLIGNGTGGSYKLGMGYISQLPRSLQLSLQPSGLVGYWPLDENSGSLTFDGSAYANNGTLQGSPTWTTGKLGAALGFASGQYVTVPTSTSLQANNVTAEAWFKLSGSVTGQTIIAKSGAWSIAVSQSNGAQLAIHDQTTDTDVCTDSTTIDDGAWHHVAMTMNSGVANGTVLYIDGAQKQVCTATVSTQANSLTIGALNTGLRPLTGTVDQARLYNRVLSSSEIAAEYAAVNAGSTAGVSLGTIVPGASTSNSADAIVQTDAPGYSLAINQDQNLTSGSYTIPSISGSIAVPAAWAEGTTKGLGFTITGTNATAIPGSWNSGNSYAAFPGTATTFYTRVGQPTAADYVTIKLRADVADTQVATATPYSNTLTLSGTMTP